jgi:preprotein translocase subunit YajC
VTLRAVLFATAMMTSAAAFAQLPAPAATATPPVASEVGALVTPAAAATAEIVAGEIVAGAAVLDSKGGSVGTIASVSGDIAVVDTGTVKVSIPVTSLAKSDKGVLIGMTRTELEAAAKAAAGGGAQANATLKAGTAVLDPKGGAVGTIESVDADTVTVATPKVKAKLPKASFALGPNGAVISMTQSQLEAAASGAKSPAG